MKMLPFLAASLLGLATPAAAQVGGGGGGGGQSPARARANLVELFSDEDYPLEAIRNHEQGPVSFTLSVGPDGAPLGCRVTTSSGSPILDSTTCRLLMERAHFDPAHDWAGKPTTDSVHGRIIWRLPADDEAEALSNLPAALLLWTVCVSGEAAKLAPGNLPPAEVVRRAYGPCTELEALAARDPAVQPSLEVRRAEISRMIEAVLGQAREKLKALPPPPAKAR